MPITQLLTPPAATAEPVSLALAAAVLRLDVDGALLAAYAAGTMPEDADPALVGQVEYLQLLLSAAREKVEAYTGRYFAAQTLRLTFELGEVYELPEGAVADSVEGYFTTLDALAARNTYLEEYRKGISINRELPWGEALAQTYTVTATIPETVNVPALAKSAILELAGEWYRNRETTLADVRTVTELPVSWKVKLAPLVRNPLGG